MARSAASGWWRSGICLVMLLAVAMPVVAEQWYESYHKAEEAIKGERWSEAVSLLSAAIEQRPESNAQARTYGMWRIGYFPYLKLGVAYVHLGQLDAALQAFESEERLGEVQRSESDWAELRRYREQCLRLQQEAEAARQQRARQVITEGLAAAARLEQEERFEDALSALTRVLSVAPDDAQALAAQQRLLAAIAGEQRRTEREERFNRLLAKGRSQLEAGRFRDAATTLSQALEVRDSEQARSLFEQAQDGLRSSIEVRDDKQRMVRDALARALASEASGDLEAALAELQSALALDPGNTEAQAALERVLGANSEAAERAERSATVSTLLAEARARLEAGQLDLAVRSANLVLALQPGNADALACITRAHAILSKALLATDNLPPTIDIDPLGPGAGMDGAPVVVASPRQRITGTVYDSSPVTLAFFAAEARLQPTALESKELQGVWRSRFTLEPRLPPGATIITVRATDLAGESAETSLRVEYEVPFVRTVWFPFVLVLALAALGSGVLLHRHRRRRSLLHRRFNPYVAGAPILDSDRFFGRRRLLEYVLRRINNNSILLYGERRIGKTSLQHQLKQYLGGLDDPDYQYYPVYIDLQGTRQERFFAVLAAEIFHELEPLLDGLQPCRSITEDGYGYRDFVKDIQAVLKVLRERGSKRTKVVLLIDEVDELNDYDPRVNQKLRSLFMRTFAENLVTVVSGVGIKKQWEREGSPWYNFFQEIEVKPFDQEEARALIEAPVRGVLTFDDGVVDEILRRTGCKPYLMQRFCSALVDRAHDGRRRNITAEDVAAVVEAEGSSICQ